MFISYIIPTRNRPERLGQTLSALDELDISGRTAEAIVIDNASDADKHTPLTRSLNRGLPLRAVSLDRNIGAAARNEGARIAQGEWLVMLDDDSHPLDDRHVDRLREAPDDVAAIGAEIFLPDGSRERGGLPEVFVGCGAAIRRDAFLDSGGYDATFEYYAEEYDLCAKLLMRGWRIEHDFTNRFRVLHEKTTLGRDFNRIVHRLVRNNAWVMQRYAPERSRHSEIAHIIERYAGIAMREHAAGGFAAGMNDLMNTLDSQPRTPMSPELFERFTGQATVREQIDCIGLAPGSRIAIVDVGKNAHVIVRALQARECVIVDCSDRPDWFMVGTLSPGPMRDAMHRHRHNPRVLAPCATDAGCVPAASDVQIRRQQALRHTPAASIP